MGRFICHHEDWFFEWSTVVDAPVTEAMTRAEFEAYYQEEYGRSSMDTLPARMARAITQGTSSRDGDSLIDLASYNRAGPNEECLSFDNLIEHVIAQRTASREEGGEG